MGYRGLGALRDIRYALRNMRHAPGFFAGVVLILALGIGLSTATFAVFYAVLLRPLPVIDQDRLVVLGGEMRGSRAQDLPISRRMLGDFRRETRTLSSVAGVAYDGPWTWYVHDPEDPRQAVMLRASVITANFFDVLGSRAEIGRTLRAEDDDPGAPRVVVISHDLWRRQYGEDSSVLARSIVDQQSGQEYRIVGVMAPGLAFERGADAWRPLNAQFPVKTDSDLDNIYAMVRLVGRLNAGVHLDAARGEFGTFFQREMAERHAEVTGQLGASARPLATEILGDVTPALRIISAAVGLVLLITCVNVANLMLIRGTRRAPELAVRSSLGATRPQLVRQLMAEGVLIAGVGGVTGVLVASGFLRGLVALAPAQLPRIGDSHIDLPTLGAAIFITAITVILFALGPALTVSSAELFTFVRTGSRNTGSRSTNRARRALVVVQFALALVVVAAAAVLGRSLQHLQHLDLGFESDHLGVVELRFPESARLDAVALNDINDRLRARVAALPGVVSVTAAIQTPFRGGGISGIVSAEGESPARRASDPVSDLEFVAPGFFQTMGTRILKGRAFEERDGESGSPVVVISKSVADHYWPGQDVPGKRLHCLGGPELCTVIGVAEDTHYLDLVKPHLTVYRPSRQAPAPVFAPRILLIRSAGDPARALGEIRSVVTSAEPLVTVGHVLPVRQLLDAPLAQPRMNAMLVGVFAFAALVLASIGIFGVIAAHVAERTRELGIRQALGATPAALTSMLVREGIALSGLGVIVGLAIALAGTRALRAILVGVSPTDPLALLGATALLVACGLAGVIIPARRAAAVDPSVALRTE